MKNNYDILPEFKRLPSFNLSFKAWIVALINGLMALDRLFRRNRSGISMQRKAIPRADGSTFPVIIMTPPGITSPMPCLIYYHGGAFALSYGSSHIKMCQRYASGADCCVIFVDYRLMPAHPFPAGLEDSHRALQWTVENADAMAIDKEKIVVGGDSAGGALAALVSQMSLDRGTAALCGQLLIYPVTDMDCKTRSAREYPDTPIWTSISNTRMWKTYLKDYSPGEVPPYASPIHRDNCSDLPPVYLETAEYDPLHDEGVDYAKKLMAAGVDVLINETRGTVHGYDGFGDSPVSREAVALRIGFLNSAFSG